MELVKKLYDVKELPLVPFNYDVNVDLRDQVKFEKREQSSICIQIGNSATDTNNHVDCFGILKKFKDNDIKIIAPLSYGSNDYGAFVKQNGIRIFKDRFVPLEQFVSYETYLKQLNETDLAIMYHNRSQAFGNCVMLLSLGKKLYLKNRNPLYQLFNKVGIKVFDAELIKDMTFEEFSKPLTEEEKNKNLEIVRNLFSEKKRLEDFARVLN